MRLDSNVGDSVIPNIDPVRFVGSDNLEGLVPGSGVVAVVVVAESDLLSLSDSERRDDVVPVEVGLVGLGELSSLDLEPFSFVPGVFVDDDRVPFGNEGGSLFGFYFSVD